MAVLYDQLNKNDGLVNESGLIDEMRKQKIARVCVKLASMCHEVGNNFERGDVIIIAASICVKCFCPLCLCQCSSDFVSA